MKLIPHAICLAGLLLGAVSFASADDFKFAPMPDKPKDQAEIDAQQAAATKKVQDALDKFDATYAGRIRLDRVKVPTVDGHQEPAYIFTPANLDPSKKRPGLVFVRESAHGQFLASYFHLIEEAIGRGYTVICPEIRGSSGYGLAYFRDLDIAGLEIDDVLSATDYLLQHQPTVDSSRLAVMGISHGGTMVLYALEKAPERFKVGVDIVGPVSLAAYLSRRTTPWDQAEFYGQPSLAGAQKDPSILIDKAPTAHVDRIKASLLILAVTNDRWTPVSMHAGPLEAALDAAGIGHEYQLFRDAPDGHLFFTGDSQLAKDAMEDCFTFMDRALR